MSLCSNEAFYARWTRNLLRCKYFASSNISTYEKQSKFCPPVYNYSK